MNTERNNSGGRSYIPGLYGLRAFAAIAVVSYHLFSYDIKGGYLGVCLFFVLSGFLLAGKGTLELSRREFSVGEFYLKRLRRIYPPLILFVFVTYGVFYFLEPDIIKGTRDEFWAMILGYHNWWQVMREGSYFSKLTAISPFRHIWSLSMEIQFYLIYPLVFFIFLTLLKHFKKKTALIIFGIISAVSAVPMTVALLSGVDLSRIYYGTDMRFFAILFGMLTGFLSVGVAKTGPVKNRVFHEICVYIAFAAMIASFLALDGQSDITYIIGMQNICIIMSFLTFEIADGRLSISRLLEFAPLKWIGSRSYEIYLWHYPFVAYLHYHKLMSDPLYVIGALLLSLVVAEIAYRISGFIDKSIFADNESGIFSKGLTVAVVILLVVLGGFITYTVSDGERFDTKELAKELTENQQMLESQDEIRSDIQSVSDDQGMTADATENAADETVETTATDENKDEVVAADTETIKEAAGTLDPDSLTFVGDSVTLGASPDILERFPNAYVDAETSRQVRGCTDVLRTLESEGHLGKDVVILLGINGPFLEKDVQEILDYLGPNRHVWWVNAYGAHVEWQDRVNEVITTVAAANENMTVVDWASAGVQHPEWFYDDGVHLNKTGQAGFADFLFTSLTAQ